MHLIRLFSLFLAFPKLLSSFLLLELDFRVVVVYFEFPVFKTTFIRVKPSFFYAGHLFILQLKLALSHCRFTINRLDYLDIAQAGGGADRCFEWIEVRLYPNLCS